MTSHSKNRNLFYLALAGALAMGACGPGLRSSSASTGALTGHLIIEGGTSQNFQPRPLTGTVSFIQHGRVVATAATAPDGTFSQTLDVGAYQVRACTSHIQEITPTGVHIDSCDTGVPATVSANHTTTVDIPDFIVP
jgi:hypothetical protein